jgi:hypothetical protein
MRFWLRVAIVLGVLACVGAGVWYCLNQERLARQWASYRIGAAKTLEQARTEIARLETGPDRQTALRDLVAKWGTGNQQFDLYLAWYVGHPSSSDLLRETFSLESAWRESLLPRWAHYWSWRVQQEPDQEIASILAHLDVLSSTEPPEAIPWREVLDLQAVFELTGESRLAKRLSPNNWRDRYQTWQKARKGQIPHVARPEAPFPDWEGTVPDRKRLTGL